MARQTSKKTVANARRLRKTMSLPEVLLWNELKGRKGGIRIRRQHPAGPYIIDLYCPSAKLAVEIDGLSHELENQPQRDANRDEFLMSMGIETIRIAASDVLKSPVKIAEAILKMCRNNRL